MDDEQKARQRVGEATDDDGLTGLSCASDMSQDEVRVGDWWFRLDRVPWQIAQHASRARADWPRTRVRVNLGAPGVRDDEHRFYVRKAYWWGERLDWGKVDRQELRDLTVYADPAKPMHVWGPQMCRFWWNYPDARTAALQVEEFAKVPAPGVSPVSRYMHTIRTSGVFVHLDFACKTYASRDDYDDAYRTPRLKNALYEKVFRTDADLALDGWRDYVGAFFAMNPLVQEYLNGE